jgi:hypothetical protein
MKKIIAVFCISVMICSNAFTGGDVLPIGSQLPNRSLKMLDVSGKMISMEDAKKANGVLVMFSANTCPYVLKYQQRTIAIGNLAQNLNIGVILLNSNEAQRNHEDSYQNMKLYAAHQKYNWSYVVDKNNVMADAFDATRTPECFLFNKDLVLVYHGSIDDNPVDPNAVKRSHLKEAIIELSQGKEITVKESRGVGCGIKRAR